MAETHLYRVGDIVRHKTSHRYMTVGEVKADLVQCDWFDDDCEAHREFFPAEFLEGVIQQTPRTP